MAVERHGHRIQGALARIRFILSVGVLSAAGCVTGWRSTKAPPLPNIGTAEWRVVELNHQPVAQSTDAARAWLKFDDKAKHVEGSGGCNRVSGPFTRDAQYLHFGKLISTMMACTDTGVNSQDQQFHEALQHIDRYDLRSDTLALSVGADRVAMLVH
jgi:putative lipoprotein